MTTEWKRNPVRSKPVHPVHVHFKKELKGSTKSETGFVTCNYCEHHLKRHATRMGAHLAYRCANVPKSGMWIYIRINLGINFIDYCVLGKNCSERRNG